LAFVGVFAAAAGALSAATSVLPVAAKDSLIAQAARGQLRPARIPITIGGAGRRSASTQTYRTLPFFSGGVLDAATNALAARDARDTAGDTGAPAGSAGTVVPGHVNGNGNESGDQPGTLGMSLGTVGCSQRLGNGSEGDNSNSGAKRGNVRVNQDCTYRRQAEEMIAYNPANPNNLLAGQNDSRVGFNQCGIDWSINNGKNWGDLLPPFRQKLNNPSTQEPTPGDPNRHTIAGGDGTIHTYDAGSDPALAFDSRGNSYFSCVGFDVASNASLLYVTQSPASAQGSFFFNLSSFGKKFVVAEDNSPLVFHDKNMIVADKNASSPNRDNVYVTWTVFKFGANCLGGTPDNPQFCESPIFGSMSTDGARHWSTPEEISGVSTTYCSQGNFFDPAAPPAACNFDQGSNPTALPNGDLEVIFNNGNTATTNPNAQQLGVHCHPTGSSPAGTAHLNCVAPSKVGDDMSFGEPLCDFGRAPEECIPGPNIRTNDFPIVSKNTQNNHLYATWQDYQRRDNGAKEYSIQLSESLDGGLTWHEVGTVNPDTGLDHYFPAVEQSPASAKSDENRANGEGNGGGNADRVGVSYYRSDRVPGENTPANAFAFTPCPSPEVPPAPCNAAFHPQGNSDYVLAGGTGSETPYNFKVVSPAFPPPDGVQAGFNGDYSGLTINRGIEAHPIWSDTRNANPYPENGVKHDEDVFTVNTALPNGRAELQTGQIGSEKGRSGGDQSGG